MAGAGMSPWAPLLALPAVLAFVVLFAVPVGFLVAESLHKFSLLGAVSGVTPVNYIKLLSDPYYLGLLAETLKLSALASFLCLVLGTPVAWTLRLAPSRI